MCPSKVRAFAVPDPMKHGVCWASAALHCSSHLRQGLFALPHSKVTHVRKGYYNNPTSNQQNAMRHFPKPSNMRGYLHLKMCLSLIWSSIVVPVSSDWKLSYLNFIVNSELLHEARFLTYKVPQTLKPLTSHHDSKKSGEGPLTCGTFRIQCVLRDLF